MLGSPETALADVPGRGDAREPRDPRELGLSLLASVPIPLLVLDPQGHVVHASRSWTAVARCAECPDAMRPGTEYGEGVRAVREGRKRSFEAEYHCAQCDRPFRAAVTAAGDGSGALIVETDIGEIERTRAELDRSRRELRAITDRLDAGTAALRAEPFPAHGFEQIVGTSAALGKVLRGIEQVAAADSPVLLFGETGTGKDLVARAIHERSRRKGRPLVPVNCAALPDALIESELFGYEKGAFTGAVMRTIGRFEAADGGSVLLDEIGEMPLSAQAKLLRVLEDGSLERLGSSRTLRVDVRVIAATNRDLEKEVREGRFRADLFYRLNVFPVSLPPLRERPEDIPLLVWHFINAKQGALGRSIEQVPDRLMRALQAYAWPGNIRELENVIERALIVTTGPTLAVDAGFLERAPGPAAHGTTLDDVQRAHIQEVLRQCGWKVAGKGNAAERLGLKRGTLQFRMKKLGISRPSGGA